MPPFYRRAPPQTKKDDEPGLLFCTYAAHELHLQRSHAQGLPFLHVPVVKFDSGYPDDLIQLVSAIEKRIDGSSKGVEVDMLSWMGRTALELIGQAGLGYSFDPLVKDTPDTLAHAIKAFQYVSPQ